MGSASQFQVDGTGNATTANLRVAGTFTGYTGSFQSIACTTATCSARLDVTGTGTFNSVSTNTLTTGSLVDTGGLNVTGTGSFGNVACSGTDAFASVQATADVVYNSGKSLTTQMSTLNGYKTSGTIAGTSTLQTIYTVALGTRGFITVIAMGPTYNMFMGFFEWTTSGTYQSLTQLAQSGNNTQAVLNTTNASSAGTVTLTVQQVSNAGTIQAKVATNSTINWYVTLI